MNRKKRTVKNIIFAAAVLAFAAALIIIPFAMESRQSAQTDVRVLSVTAEADSISTTLSGTGTLTDEEASDVTVPDGVELLGYYVSNGDTVSEGDAVAKVNRTSVMQAISSLQETLEYLEDEMEDLDSGSDTKTLTAASAARVKAVYAEVGDDIQNVILENGCLAVLSLDGYMAVSFECNTDLQAGDAITVTEEDGTEIEGKVDSVRLGTAVVLISDAYGEIGETVTVSASDGTVLATGTLYVHSESRITSYTGTVSKIYVKTGDKVKADGKLFYLTGTDDSSVYEMRAQQHRQYEEIMMELFVLYQDGTVTAPCDGVVSGIPDNAVLLSSDGTGYTVSLLSDPSNPDCYYHRFGQVVSVEGSSVTVSLSQELSDLGIALSDYSEVVNMRDTISGLSYSEGEKTVSASTVYYWTGSSWTQKELNELQPGDTLLLVYGKNLVWVIGTTQVASDQPSSDQPSGSETGDAGSQTEYPSGDTGSYTGGMSSYGITNAGTVTVPETFSMYSTENTSILSVTPQDTVTVTITVDELDILSVAVGQETNVTIDALPGRSFSGTLTSIDTEGTNNGGNSKYTAVITLNRTEDMLAGMNASAGIVLKTEENVLTIPAAALIEEGTKTYVYTSYDEESGEFSGITEITTGVSDGTNVQIISGLTEGETVWYSVYDSTLSR